MENRLADPQSGGMDVKALVGKATGVRALAKWFIRLRILPQFHLADELLYGGVEMGESLEG